MNHKESSAKSSIQEKSLRLYEALVSGRGMSNLVQVASKILGNPLSVSDSSFRLLDYSRDTEVDDPVWHDIIVHGMSSLEVIEKFNKEQIIDRVLTSDQPILISDGIGKNMNRILGKICIADKAVGYVGVFEVNHPLTEEDILLTSILSSVLSVELSKNPAVSKLTGTLLENLFIDLIQDTAMEEDEIEHRLRASKWYPHPNFYLLYIPIEASIYTHYKIEYVCSYLSTYSSQVQRVYINKSVLILVSFRDQEELSPFWETLRTLLTTNDLCCGVSFPFDHLRKLRTAHEQAAYAFTYGKKLSPKSPIYSYDEYYDLYLIRELQLKTPLSDYAHGGIQNLLQYDKDHNSSYASRCSYILIRSTIYQKQRRNFLSIETP
ncbi:hypothetical protein [Proteiniclasticum ruminis]|uniref:CdaR GGDEF-like domain-containing protein n=1 Tax=Proteiniclasticum ruminis TaxID=398199 RepID=A0A1I5C0X6_9CLOT|nr:hypothetical protein [Proteiniclasticum ruminis]SFN80649.1 hypothetical protein SAMN04488695_105162 [Proteiniclasticum ruminis]